MVVERRTTYRKREEDGHFSLVFPSVCNLWKGQSGFQGQQPDEELRHQNLQRLLCSNTLIGRAVKYAAESSTEIQALFGHEVSEGRRMSRQATKWATCSFARPKKRLGQSVTAA